MYKLTSRQVDKLFVYIRLMEVVIKQTARQLVNLSTRQL